MAAHTKASAIPVLPLVGSMITVSGPILPSASSASIIDQPMRSLTEDSGLKNSHLPRMSASTPYASASRDRRTSGVAPIVPRMLS